MSIVRRGLCAAFLVAAGMAATPIASAAEQDKTPGSGPNPYTDCGIGAALFPNTHWAAVTSNIIWDLGTTAVTSATSSPQTCKGKNLQAAMFIGTTYDELAEETAAGKGRHLSAMLNLFGCSADRHAGAILQVRATMGKAVAASGYADLSHIDKASTYFNAAEKAVANSCAA
jgi:hypothetical protein